MDAACDDIALHGAACLVKPIPYPLYVKCIVRYAEICARTTLLNATTLLDPYVRHSHAFLLAALRDILHADLDDSNILDEDIEIILKCSEYDVEGTVQCLHRFAARCMAACKFELMISLMNNMLRKSPCKVIRQVLMQYGAALNDKDEASLVVACRNSDASFIRRAFSNGQTLCSRGAIYIDNERFVGALAYVKCVVGSGDSDTIRLVIQHLRTNYKIQLANDARFSVRDLDAKTCDILLELGVFHVTAKYHLTDIVSVGVLGWFIVHDLVSLSDVFDYVSDRAVRGGPYVDVLHYLVEQAHVPVPRDILGKFKPCVGCDLGVVDYLIAHGAEIAPDPTATVLLLRYLLDKGIDLTAEQQHNILRQCMTIRIPVQPIDMFIQVMGTNVDTLLSVACIHSDSDVKLLIGHGADPNVAGGQGLLPLMIACAKRSIKTVELLLDHGADPNASTITCDYPDTALAVACERQSEGMVDLLLKHGADLHNDSHHKVLCAACMRKSHKIVMSLLTHGAETHHKDASGNTPLHYACAHGWTDVVEM